MNSELRDLYQQVILDHYKRPRNFRVMDPHSAKADGHNALCGDRVTVYLLLQDGIVKDVSFQGAGCAICVASSSLMTDFLKGKTVQEAEAFFHHFHELVMGNDTDGSHERALGKLSVLGGVQEFPMRVKCATLAWHTFNAAAHGAQEPVSTE